MNGSRTLQNRLKSVGLAAAARCYPTSSLLNIQSRNCGAKRGFSAKHSCPQRNFRLVEECKLVVGLGT
jgi:hypothetical protein